ncbi:hypothetical protein nbrc107696_44980 [Gordonia spumicola]|uniref:Uncharacterized protein n=1 Tax=Gordonia spumicola TaxID=589161 RepID=A0A7I9VFS2_9ACTN|nr:hypothetical protein nbrc107696_44980 [Gordonia spumicola]
MVVERRGAAARICETTDVVPPGDGGTHRARRSTPGLRASDWLISNMHTRVIVVRGSDVTAVGGSVTFSCSPRASARGGVGARGDKVRKASHRLTVDHRPPIMNTVR